MACKKLFKLNNGNMFPLVGLGTYCIQGLDSVKTAIDHALQAGYRSFDTASMYENEEEIGAALQELLPKHNLKRQDVFLTSKLAPEEQGAAPAEKAVRGSIRRLRCEYLDLYLIHWPGAEGMLPSDPRNAVLRRESWASMVKLHREGLIHNLGVSNYMENHLQQLLDDCDGVKPAVNQVEWHPHHCPQKLLDFCRSKGILLQAYSSLGGSVNRAVVQDSEAVKVAEELGESVQRVLLRWALQQDIAIIPKARSPHHIRDNFTLDFVIPEEQMNKLNNLKTRIRYDWDPEQIV